MIVSRRKEIIMPNLAKKSAPRAKATLKSLELVVSDK
jgi:hypothetical protein